MSTWKCKLCGSKDVESKDWVKLNTGKATGTFEGTDEDTWCCSCEKHAGVELVEDQENNEEKSANWRTDNLGKNQKA